MPEPIPDDELTAALDAYFDEYHRIYPSHAGHDGEAHQEAHRSAIEAVVLLARRAAPPKPPAMPPCPVCGGVTVEGERQRVTVRPAGALSPVFDRGGQIAYRCERGHYHDGERETGPVPEDVEIVEGP